MLTYRHYQPGDEQAIVVLWNMCLPKDPIIPQRFRKLVLLDANFDPEGMRLAYADDRLIGCAYAIRRLLPMLGTDLEPDNGWITFFFVHPAYRRQGAGAQLLKEAAAFLRKHGRKYLFFSSYAPNYIVPGIDQEAYPAGYRFLQQQGFARLYSPIAMDRSLVDFQMPEDVQELTRQKESEGYTFRAAALPNGCSSSND